jgi:hypothetical protein
MMMTYYGSVEKADQFFDERLHASVWADADNATKVKALKDATRAIDRLSFKGTKASVYAVDTHGAQVTDESDRSNNDPGADVRAANRAQALEFPRDGDTTVPTDIEQAAYLIAYALLDGRDPELELENLSVTSHRYSSVGTVYNRDMTPLAHIVNGIPSVSAWNLLSPYLRPATELRITRV